MGKWERALKYFLALEGEGGGAAKGRADPVEG